MVFMLKNISASIGLVNPKSPTNVGAVMRAAGCYGVDSVFYSGVRFDRARKFATDTKNVSEHIPLIGIADLKQAVPEGAKVIAVELIEGATALTRYQHPDNAFYVFGPEDGSLGKDILKWCDDVVYIPTIGCMNLAATVNVVLYDRLAKSPYTIEGDELIRKSRDANNKVNLKDIK
ncbi:RNA methyltransferase [Pseudoalteromonas tunicata]|uniref:RNA methyltransferase n=1 Tax=Pseudoalteromonas tunicata TaxID=314281 RepID=UPI00273FD693|nr:RNA methyltransferase [Pseudoalteromonas tunicata]MDP4984738.1 RNA methyltransferase [Pseudoalteromonas tunicata]MDP5214216.1 RNA methyltransferase [Pseudoalteromonas tunicata]